jgi:alkanesulfonate monooxygenase SsuD/methylene tetrahydromethanopterin reductase-like flavin-dependent oxidoreductase (luciferase family)
MKVSYFETGRYVAPPDLPREWPVPPAAYDPDTGAEALRDMVERVKFVEALGFDWVSVSEHHYSPRILTPSPVVSATWLAARVDKIKIALLGPIVPVNNPIRIAEELAMLDTLAPGRIVVGLLRGTTNEYLSYDLNPKEARERTDEGMELILKAWTEPQPFGWQGGISSTARCRSGHVPSVSRIHRPTGSAPAPKPANSPRAIVSASACPTARST